MEIFSQFMELIEILWYLMNKISILQFLHLKIVVGMKT